TADRAFRLGQNGGKGRAAAATDAAAATVEQAQPHRMAQAAVRVAAALLADLVAHLLDRLRRLVQMPARSGIATVLVGVGIAKHHFLNGRTPQKRAYAEV